MSDPRTAIDAIREADDNEALDLEREVVEQTDNGWQEGDPLEQPENPEPWTA